MVRRKTSTQRLAEKLSLLTQMIETQEQRLQQLEQELAIQTERANHFEQAYKQLKVQYEQLRRYRFGQKSERYVDANNPQLSLFSIDNDANTSDEPEAPVEHISYTRRKAHKKTGKQAPRRIVIIPVDDEQKRCGCGGDKQVIRYQTREYYDYVPARFELIEERREVVACPKGCDRSLTTAKTPAHILPKVKASHRLLAHIVVSKLLDRQPLYHLEQQFLNRYHVDITRTRMANWCIKLASPVQPIINLMKDNLLSYDIAGFDATHLQVLREPGREPTTKSYVYCLRGGPPDKPVVLYEYNAHNHQSFCANSFQGFTGTIHTDADPFFAELAALKGVDLSYCNAHARRKIEPIAKAVDKRGVAHHIMAYYRQLYAIERQAKRQQLSPEKRHALRLEKATPILDELQAYITKTYHTLLPKSPLAVAVAYIIKHWQQLCYYLNDGRLEFDNNLTEQEIKLLVLARKNFMFAHSVRGANALCNLFGLVRTAICNGCEPYAYLTAVFDNIPYCNSVEDYEKLLPWHIKREQSYTQYLAA